MPMEYEELLERAFTQLPERKPRGERFQVPQPEIVVSGKRTFILNVKQLCEVLNREPRVLLRYLLKELGASGGVEEDVIVIHGVFSPRIIRSLIERFINEYVYCPVCHSPDTIFKREHKVIQIKCMACGATSPARPF